MRPLPIIPSFFRLLGLVVLMGLLGLSACDSNDPVSVTETPPPEEESKPTDPEDPPPQSTEVRQCPLPPNEIRDGGPGKDGIPALTDPPLVSISEVTFIEDDNRVLGLFINGEAIAIPHNILWWHEIINFNFAGLQLTVTYCPLTGSGIAYDRAAVDGAEFGVSGLLYQNNLIMYDRNETEALWPQLGVASGCTSSKGIALPTYPVFDMTWAGWKLLYPETKVVSSDTGFGRDYRRFPYGDYEDLNFPPLFPLPNIDSRRPPKERVLGIPVQDGSGIGFPFGKLDEAGPANAIHFTFDEQSSVVFWDRGAFTAGAFSTTQPDGTTLTFRPEGNRIVDEQTGSTWQVDGLATSGPMAGTRLEQVPRSYIAFWFAWAAFQPDATLFGE